MAEDQHDDAVKPELISAQRSLEALEAEEAAAEVETTPEPGEPEKSANPKKSKKPKRSEQAKLSKPPQRLGRLNTQEPDTKKSAENVLAFPETPQQRRQKRHRLTWIISGIVVVLVVAIVLVVYFSPVLAIRTIRISGTELMAQHKAEELLDPLHGRPLPQVGDQQVLELVGEDPAIASVSTRAEPPETLIVEITEHEPVAMAPIGDAFTMFNEQGQAIATITAEQAQNYSLPVVASADDVSDPALFNAISEVLGQLPQDLRAQVTTASAATLDSITLALESGKTVLWGNTDQPEQKVAVLQALLTLPEEEAAQVQVYDVSTPDHPVTR